MIVSNAYDTDGRGPSDTRLRLLGLTLVLIVSLVVSVLLMKARGRFDDVLRISAELINVGDGLPAQSDVKFRGVLVGTVTDVVPAGAGRANIVHLEIKNSLARGIPGTVSARVVPSNVFAVSSVQLVENTRPGTMLRPGLVIPEDHTLPTILFQTTLTKFREVLKAVGRNPSPDTLGILDLLGEATQGRGQRLSRAGGDLNRIVQELNTVVAEGDQSAVSALADAVRNLREVSPELFDALQSAVVPMHTLAEKRSALQNLLSAGVQTLGTVGQAFDNQTDRLIAITTQLTPVAGVFADNAAQFRPIFTRLQRLADNVYNEAWNPDTNLFTIKAVVSFTPTRTYVRADCPRYGDMAGPSCQIAPEIPKAPDLLPALASKGFFPGNVPENRPNLAPPRNSIPPPPEKSSSDGPEPIDGTATQPSAFGGSVGPVGSRAEKSQLAKIIGAEPSAATQLLLGPVARGSTVNVQVERQGGR